MTSQSVAMVSGATGFIGTALVKRLHQEGWKVHAVVRPDSKPDLLARLRPHCTLHQHRGSTEQLFEIFSAAKPTTVFHLASMFLAQHQAGDIEPLIRSNLLFATQLAEATIQSGCRRFLNTGTSWQHYHSQPNLPVNLYAATKQAFEAVLRYYHDSASLSVITLKLYDTYGPGDPRRKLINLLMDAMASGKPLAMSPGEQIIDLTYIDDVVEGYCVAEKRFDAGCGPLMDAFFLSGERLSLRELARIVADELNQPLNVSFGGRPYRPREVMTPIPAGDRLLPGWHPSIKLREGLQLLKAAYFSPD